MKGLLIKDYKLILQQKRLFVIFVGIWIMLLLTNEADNFSFAVSYLMFVLAMFTVSTISYDQYDNGMAFLMTLPTSRVLYVREKYFLAVMNTVVSAFFSVLVTFILGEIRSIQCNSGELVSVTIVLTIIVLVMLAFMLPFSILFGSEKGRIVLVAVVGVCCVIGVVGSRLSDTVNLAFETTANRIFSQNPVSLIAEGVVLCICVLGISYLVTVRQMMKKEF